MRRILVIVAALAVMAGACKKSKSDADKTKEETPPAGTAKVTEPAEDKTAPAPMEMPVTTKSDEARAAFLEGRSLIDRIRFTEAEPKLRKAVELDPDFASAHAFLAIAAGGVEADKAAARAAELAADLPAAERLWITSLAAAFRNDIGAARAGYAELVKEAPTSWRAQWAAGNFYSGTGDTAAAVKAFEASIALNPDNGPIYNSLAYLYAFDGDLDKAVEAASKQVELLSGEPNPLDTKGEIEIMAGKFADAEATFKTSLEVMPDFHIARDGIAVTQLYRKDYAGAIKALTESVAAAGTPAQRAGSQFNLIMAHVLAGNDKQALAAAADFGKFAGEAGFNAGVAEAGARGRVHVHRGAWSKAYKEAKNAIAALESGEAPLGQKTGAHLFWIISAARAGDKAGAEKAFAAFESLVKEGAQHTLARGYRAWAGGDVDGALAAFAELDGTAQETNGLVATAGALEVAEKNDEAKAAWAKFEKRTYRDIDSILFWHNAMEAMK